MLELVIEKGNTRAHTWIDAEKHFHFSVFSGSFHKRKLYKGREISADEEILYRSSPFAHGCRQPVWNRRQFPVVTTKRAVLQRAWGIPRAGPGGTSSQFLMSIKWEGFYFIWNFLITQAAMSGPAGRPECCRSLHSGCS